LVDWKQEKFGVPATVKTIEYDPIRGARIALIAYKDGEKRYMLAPAGVSIGDTVMCSDVKDGVEVKVGNRLRLEFMPVGAQICNVELDPGKGGQIARGAGATATLVAIEGNFATIKLPSGEVRMVRKECMATIGQVSNPDWRLVRWGKAGRTRNRGIRPTVRGKVMNPVDHPHGGGEGRNPIGMPYPKTPTGRHALGVLTRKQKASDALIIERRKRRNG
jgi:large subunit ribosomal protein L2